MTHKDAGVVKRALTATLAILFHHLGDVSGGHPVEDKAWEQFSQFEKVLELLSLQTKSSKAKPPAQIQKWLATIHDAMKQ